MSTDQPRQPAGAHGGEFAGMTRAEHTSIRPEPVTLSFEQVVVAGGVTDPAGFAQDLRTVCGLDPAATRFTLRELTREQFSPWACGAESYLLDGDEDGYERAIEMEDAYADGDELPPIVYGWLRGDADSLQLIDGMHRCSGAHAAGLTSIPAFEATAC